MRVCLIGDFSNDLDEGYKNVSHYLAHELQTRLELITLDNKKVISFPFWRKAFAARPQIAHLIAQPTLASFLFAILCRVIWKDVRILISALRPEKFYAASKTFLAKLVIRLAKPDLILVQSQEAKENFDGMTCRVEILPNGVDVKRFHAVNPEEKKRLREKYHLDSTLPVILHVGHLEEARNLGKLIPLREQGMQVVIAGSVYMGVNRNLIDQLTEKGFVIFKGYLPEVDELYKLADCYVFPLEPGNSLSMPLSILEAMACNLCVVTTRFKGLESAIQEGDGFKFIDTVDEIGLEVLKVLEMHPFPSTREKVVAYSWDMIASRLVGYYQECLETASRNLPNR